MDRITIAEQVKIMIAEQLDIDEAQVTESDSFLNDLGADSLDIVEMVMAFEEQYGIEIPDEDTETFLKVKDAIDYVEAIL